MPHSRVALQLYACLKGDSPGSLTPTPGLLSRNLCEITLMSLSLVPYRPEPVIAPEVPFPLQPQQRGHGDSFPQPDRSPPTQVGDTEAGYSAGGYCPHGWQYCTSAGDQWVAWVSRVVSATYIPQQHQTQMLSLLSDSLPWLGSLGNSNTTSWTEEGEQWQWSPGDNRVNGCYPLMRDPVPKKQLHEGVGPRSAAFCSVPRVQPVAWPHTRQQDTEECVARAPWGSTPGHSQ